jgi:hypothetical protein
MPLDPHQLSSIQPNLPPHASLAPVPWLSPPPTRSRSQRHGRALATSRNCRSGAAADSAAKREKGRPPAAGASPAFRQHTQSMRSARTTHGAPIRGGAILRPSARRMLLGEYDPGAGPTPSDPDECHQCDHERLGDAEPNAIVRWSAALSRVAAVSRGQRDSSYPPIRAVSRRHETLRPPVSTAWAVDAGGEPGVSGPVVALHGGSS